MKRLRQHFGPRWLCLFMVGYLVNTCVDAPDWRPQSVPEDLSYNDIESITEWVVEDVFGWKDFFKEYDDNDDESLMLFKKVAAWPLPPLPPAEPTPVKKVAVIFESERSSASGGDQFFDQFNSEPPVPPPWA